MIMRPSVTFAVDNSVRDNADDPSLNEDILSEVLAV